MSLELGQAFVPGVISLAQAPFQSRGPGQQPIVCLWEASLSPGLDPEENLGLHGGAVIRAAFADSPVHSGRPWPGPAVLSRHRRGCPLLGSWQLTEPGARADDVGGPLGNPHVDQFPGVPNPRLPLTPSFHSGSDQDTAPHS